MRVLFVHCRVGSLEITATLGKKNAAVHCRVGSLEIGSSLGV